MHSMARTTTALAAGLALAGCSFGGDDDAPDDRAPDGVTFTVGSPVVTPTALEMMGQPLSVVRAALAAWAAANCETEDCLVYVEPLDAGPDCLFVGSDPGPGVEVDYGATVELFADCDLVDGSEDE